MPRGVRKSTEEQIIGIDCKIKALQEQKKQLINTKEQEDIKKLLEAAKDAGISPADLVKQLTEKSEIESV